MTGWPAAPQAKMYPLEMLRSAARPWHLPAHLAQLLGDPGCPRSNLILTLTFAGRTYTRRRNRVGLFSKRMPWVSMRVLRSFTELYGIVRGFVHSNRRVNRLAMMP